jgi:hypothetical protein
MSGAWAALVNSQGSDEHLALCEAAMIEIQQETRRKVLREARDAAAGEHLHEDTGCPEDEAYDEGVSDAVQAIERLMEGD